MHVEDSVRDLYQEVIMDHNKSPRNFGALDGADRHAEGQNPLCGDEVALFLKVDGDKVVDVRFTGHGCAISKASASMMTEAVKGKTLAEAETLYQHFHRLVTTDAGEADAKVLGKLRVFAGVHEFPARVKCAALAWRTLEAALQEEERPVTTE